MVKICVGSSFQVRYEGQFQHPCVDPQKLPCGPLFLTSSTIPHWGTGWQASLHSSDPQEPCLDLICFI